MSERNRGPIVGMIIFIVGSIFGGITALFMATNEEGETHEEVKTRIALSKARKA